MKPTYTIHTRRRPSSAKVDLTSRATLARCTAAALRGEPPEAPDSAERAQQCSRKDPT